MEESGTTGKSRRETKKEKKEKKRDLISQMDGANLTEPESFGNVGRENEMEKGHVLLAFLFNGRGGFFNVLFQLVQATFQSVLRLHEI